MIIKRNLQTDGNILPSVYNLLSAIPDNILHNHHYLLAHPKQIYLRSLRRIFNAFRRVIEAHNECWSQMQVYMQLDPNSEAAKAFPKAALELNLTEMFHAISAHIDDCYHIMKTTCSPPANPINITFADKWLKKVKHPTVQLFQDSIQDYKAEIATVVNKIKHQHGRIECVFGSSNKDESAVRDFFVAGYYMTTREEVTNEGVLEVFNLNEIHAIGYDLKYHLFSVYCIGEILYKCLEDAVKHQHNISLPYQIADFSVEEYNELFEMFQTLPIEVFPNIEILNPKTFIKYDKGALTLQYPIGFTEGNYKMRFSVETKEENGITYIISTIPTETLQKQIEDIGIGSLQIELTNENFSDHFYTMTIAINTYNMHYDLITVEYSLGVNVRTIMGPGLITRLTMISEELDERLHVKNYRIEYFEFSIGIPSITNP